jgi:uncharacterized protein YecA (UPF0149 family)
VHPDVSSRAFWFQYGYNDDTIVPLFHVSISRFPATGGEGIMSRTNWYSEHPLACTCATCQERQFMLRDRGSKIGRNEKCPCNSGKKYKKCHGSL